MIFYVGITRADLGQELCGLAEKLSRVTICIKDVPDLLYEISKGSIPRMIVLDADYIIEHHKDDVYDIINAIEATFRCRKLELPPITVLVRKKLCLDKIKMLNIKGVIPHPTICESSETECAVQEILSGQTHFPKKIFEKGTHKEVTTKFTAREQNIVDLICNRGCSNKSLAKILGCAESTVKMHMTSIFKKSGVRNRTQLVVFEKPEQK